MQDLIYKYYKNFISKIKRIIIYSKNFYLELIDKYWYNNFYLELIDEYIENNPYLELFYEYVQNISLDIKEIKKNLKNFKTFYLNLSIWKHCLILYFFFTGVIPFLFVILFWIYFILVLLNYILLSINIFFFKLLLIITQNNKFIIIAHNYFIKFYNILLFLYDVLSKVFCYVIITILNIITLKWWKIKTYSIIINPIDKLLCKLLDLLLSFFPFILNWLIFVFENIITNILISRENWIMIYKPKFRKFIIKVKMLKLYKINWFYYFSNIIRSSIILKKTLYMFVNKWFWLYFFQIYFFHMFLQKYIIICFFFIYHLYYKFLHYFTILKYTIFVLFHYYPLLILKIIIYKIIFFFYTIIFNINIYVYYFYLIIKRKLFFFYNWIPVTWWFLFVFKLLLLFDIKYQNYIELRLTYFNDINFVNISKIKLYNTIYIYIKLYSKFQILCFIIYWIYKF